MVMKATYTTSRFVASFLILIYGFAKINGSQFTILASELDKPMREVSGFWLTWYYFGYSSIYGNFIALVQITGGILLMFRKTTLLGSCILLPVITNIIFVDIFYAIDPGALLVALIIEAVLIVILAPHKDELVEVFWRKQNSFIASGRSGKLKVYGTYAIRILMILIPAIFTYWIANYNNRLPTPIDGGWTVVETFPHNESTSNALTAIFFERNRAYGECGGASFDNDLRHRNILDPLIFQSRRFWIVALSFQKVIAVVALRRHLSRDSLYFQDELRRDELLQSRLVCLERINQCDKTLNGCTTYRILE